MTALRPLRPYQARMCRECLAHIAAGRSHVAVLPTGGGKTEVASWVVAEVLGWTDFEIAVFVHRDELLDQMSAALTRRGIAHGIIAPDQQLTSHRVHVVSIPTVLKRVAAGDKAIIAWLARLRLAVLDECHHVVADSWSLLVSLMRGAVLMGLTATPWRLDGQGLGDVFCAAVRGPTKRPLIADGWLAEPHVYAPPSCVSTAGVKKIGGDFSTGALQRLMNTDALNKKALAFYLRICFQATRQAWAPALVFTTGLEHIDSFVTAAAAIGLRAAGVDGSRTSKTARRSLIEGLRERTLELLSSCDIANEGTDIPGAVAGLMLRPSASTGLVLQQAGRIDRPFWTDGFDPNAATAAERRANMAAAGKPAGILLDFVGNVAVHGMPDADRQWTLTGGVKGLERQVTATRRCARCWRVHEWADRCTGCGAPYPRAKGEPATVWHLPSVAGMRPELIASKPIAEVVARAASRQEVEAIAQIKGIADRGWVDRAMKWGREAAE